MLVGDVLLLLGWAWSWVFPINKNLWSSSYVLFTGGVGCILLATIAWVIDVRQWRSWIGPFVAFGINPITAYVGSELTAVLLNSTIKLRVGGRLQSARELIDERLLASWLDPRLASLVYSLMFAALWYVLLRLLYRRGMLFKI